MQIRNEYNLDHTVYERRYKGHIFCPYCKAVPLTVVHTNGLLYYRGHPHEEHGEGCMYTLKEIVIKDVEKIGGDIEKQAVSQLDMLLRSMVDNNQKPDTTKTGNSGQDCRDIPVVHRQQTLQKRLPQCRLELLPELLAANEAPREVNIYYGRVLCEVVSDKTPYKGADVKVLVVKDIVTKKVIMGLTMSLAVWSHFTTDTQALLQAAQQPLHIAFLGKRVPSVSTCQFDMIRSPSASSTSLTTPSNRGASNQRPSSMTILCVAGSLAVRRSSFSFIGFNSVTAPFSFHCIQLAHSGKRKSWESRR